jgi:Na+-transporting NADH:ubiquinone oxidoreductase subunit NqrC
MKAIIALACAVGVLSVLTALAGIVASRREAKLTSEKLTARMLLATAIAEQERAIARRFAESVGIRVTDADDTEWREELAAMTQRVQAGQ